MAKSILVDFDFGGVARISGLLDAVSAQDAVTLAQLKAAIEGNSWKDNVRVASTTNLTLTGPGSSIDGVTLTNGDRVLVKDQTLASQNGIYVFNGSAVAMTRADDATTFTELENAFVAVDEGTANGGTTFRQTQVNGTVGVNDILWDFAFSNAPAATESVAGIIEIATQVETDAGTDDDRAITPEKLANWASRPLRYATSIGDGSSTSFNIDHNFNTRDVTVAVYRNSGSYDEVIADVEHSTVNRVIVKFASAPTSNAYRVVIKG